MKPIQIGLFASIFFVFAGPGASEKLMQWQKGPELEKSILPQGTAVFKASCRPPGAGNRSQIVNGELSPGHMECDKAEKCLNVFPTYAYMNVIDGAESWNVVLRNASMTEPVRVKTHVSVLCALQCRGTPAGTLRCH